MKSLNIYELIFELPLYNKIEADTETIEQKIMQPLRFRGNVDGYNPELKQETTYNVFNETQRYRASYENLNIRLFLGYNTILAKCVRTGYEIRIITLLREEEVSDEEDNLIDGKYIFQKIGEYPSIADLHISKIRSYDKVLSKNKIKEFTRAIGLAAAGVGIGSFVYLRRVFEYLLDQAYTQAKNQSDWNDELFKKGRVADKIEQLKSFLPEFLIENREMYGILSKGIHELEENECLSHFEPLKIGIGIILDAKVDELEKQRKIEEARKSIQEINKNLKKS